MKTIFEQDLGKSFPDGSFSVGFIWMSCGSPFGFLARAPQQPRCAWLRLQLVDFLKGPLEVLALNVYIPGQTRKEGHLQGSLLAKAPVFFGSSMPRTLAATVWGIAEVDCRSGVWPGGLLRELHVQCASAPSHHRKREPSRRMRATECIPCGGIHTGYQKALRSAGISGVSFCFIVVLCCCVLFCVVLLC